jgi:tetratricopeptide (TPR) repeat protein
MRRTRHKRDAVRRTLLEWLRASPGYAIAAFLHLLLFVALSIATVVAATDEPPPPLAVHARLSRSREVVVRPSLQTREQPREAPPLGQVTPALTPGGAIGSAEPAGQEPVVDVQRVARDLGVGGGGRGGAGQAGVGQANPGGPTAASDAALKAGLEWLARHRTRSGAWAVDHEAGRDGEVARTGLALLCFLCGGHAPGQDGPYREVVDRALSWLRRQLPGSGVFAGQFDGYRQAIGTLALAEALTRRRSPELEDATRRAALCLENAQDSSGGGWRYQPKEPGDTSVTSWAALALKSAEHAGVRVSPRVWTRLRRFLASVETASGGTAYMPGQVSSTPAMDASGLFLRIALGEAADTPRSRAAADLLVNYTRLAREFRYEVDPYNDYYTALSLYQTGGAGWFEVNPWLRDRLVERQLEQGCERGAWEGGGQVDDVLLGTIFSVLTLETYYRYVPAYVHEAPEVLSQAAKTREPTEGERLFLQAGQELEQALREEGDARLAAAEARFGAALAALERDEGEHAPALRAEARARLVQCAAAQGAGDRALAHAEAYFSALGPTRPDAGVLRVRRLELLRRATDAVQAAVAPRASPAAAARAHAALRAAEEVAQGELEARCADADPVMGVGADARPEDDLAATIETLGRLRTRLTLAVDPEQVIARARRAFAGPAPTDSAPEAEWVALGAALERSSSVFAAFARGEVDGTDFSRAASDLAWVRERAPGRRVPPGMSARFASALEEVGVVEVTALLARGRDGEVLAAAAAFREAHPLGASRRLVDAAEREALARRLEKGEADAGERARLIALCEAWEREAPVSDGTDWPRFGALLVEAGAPELGERCFERVLEQPGARDHDVVDARLEQLRLARGRGQLAAAELHLRAIERRGGSARSDVWFERCLLRRAQGRHAAALDDYQAILRALDAERPAAWWDALQSTAETYVEAGQLGEARRVLEQVRRQDPTYGGDAARKTRFLELTIRLDAGR